ncbi:response regulator [Zhouia spongiae]|uniref:Response regulator n=1 Tax=Zhouia spongiae TaxID=2202721 RepID=A0ABY3YJA1_9FLAO|nr:response regulator [Zhouia spongiae]UNY97721.1 response regulator [Zhouia spongiae]
MKSELKKRESRPKVLVVEDNTLTVKILNHILPGEEFSVMMSHDGNEAINIIPEFEPDIIITDIMLPLKSGLEVLVFVKSNYAHIPVIVFSALGEEERAVSKAFNLGADDFIAKPFSPGEFILRIKRLLEAKKTKVDKLI